ncbi:MAG TPA: hypothetical protein PLY35_08940 [Thermotogota bacterium]|nr:hypothetical protein [Thermotogota bacterium]
MQFEDLIDSLLNESKTNNKLLILKSVSSDKIKTLLYYTYNPDFQFGIKKNVVPSSYGTHNILDMYKPIIDLLNALVNKNLTGKIAINTVSSHMSMLNEKSAKLLMMILKKDLKCGINIKALQKSYGESFIDKFKIQLANTYNPDKTYDVKFWYGSPKLDGLRCLYKHADKKLYTRNGHEIIGFNEILIECIDYCNRFNLDYVDGELYSDDIPFQTIQGIVTRTKNISVDISLINLRVFAVISKDIKNTEEMINMLHNITSTPYYHIIEVPYKIITNFYTEISKSCLEYMKRGYEGVMLRHPNMNYDWKRSNALLKYKMFLESDFTITQFNLGTPGTKYENCLGTISIKGTYDNKLIEAEVGSGFSDSERLSLWDDRDKLIGKLIEVKFQNITDLPNENQIYSLRFPVFKKLKLDR